ncbi:hypothetical protein DRE_07706 [Drechslerella stenobrocha 248]|uniref:Argonaute-binding protein 1 n=1 Tax=Drechslerella stenobrocha 248 TaxID=1043628 RepID=W7I3U0_9PEZI|nr:hypothetical protein DRE_07706 [Drechslerella stenobrocha 248]
MPDIIGDLVDQLDSLTGAEPPPWSSPKVENPTSATQPSTTNGAVATPAPAANATVAPVAKKKKKKNKNKKGKTLPTGFEENFTEAPLTPAEFNKDKEFYDPEKSVAERIEVAVQRYKAKRKFNDIRIRLLGAYLRLGGITTGDKMFGGVDQKFVKEHSTEEIARFKATDYVPEKMNRIGEARVEELDDDYEEPEYTVDFDYIVRGFLTHRVPFAFGIKTPENIEMSVNLIRNFLNFILYHNVCPEFADNLKQSLKSCDLAAEELPICSVLSDKFPGNFNKACSTLFGGYWSLIIPQEWDDADAKDPKKPEPGFTREQAQEIYDAIIGEIPGVDREKPGKEVHRDYASLEVTSIWLPPTGSPLKLGKINCVPWTPEGSTPIESRWESGGLAGELTLWCEKTVTQYAYPKMHMCCTVHELDNGLLYFDEMTGVMCSKFLEIRDEKEEEVDSDDFDFD